MMLFIIMHSFLRKHTLFVFTLENIYFQLLRFENFFVIWKYQKKINKVYIENGGKSTFLTFINSSIGTSLVLIVYYIVSSIQYIVPNYIFSNAFEYGPSKIQICLCQEWDGSDADSSEEGEERRSGRGRNCLTVICGVSAMMLFTIILVLVVVLYIFLIIQSTSSPLVRDLSW